MNTNTNESRIFRTDEPRVICINIYTNIRDKRKYQKYVIRLCGNSKYEKH